MLRTAVLSGSAGSLISGGQGARVVTVAWTGGQSGARERWGIQLADGPRRALEIDYGTIDGFICFEMRVCLTLMTFAERSGCVTLEWTRMGGESRGLRRVTVNDHRAWRLLLVSVLARTL